MQTGCYPRGEKKEHIQLWVWVYEHSSLLLGRDQIPAMFVGSRLPGRMADSYLSVDRGAVQSERLQVQEAFLRKTRLCVRSEVYLKT